MHYKAGRYIIDKSDCVKYCVRGAMEIQDVSVDT